MQERTRYFRLLMIPLHSILNICFHFHELMVGDFQQLPWADGYFDCAYEIEATCHSPDRVITFTEVARV